MTAAPRLRILFCADPFDVRQPDPGYASEVATASELGIEYDLLHFEALVDEQNNGRAVRCVPEQPEPALVVYRGWMLRPAQYTALEAALAQRGLHLLNSPTAYALCHYLPNWYPLLQDQTPRSTWIRTADFPSLDVLAEPLRIFGDKPVIIKDFVKSQKHHWDEACFIPSASDLDAAERIVRRFLELQGPDLNEGLVFREYESFEPLAAHSRSGMPLTREYRLFFLDGEPILSSEYWEEGEYEGPLPPFDHLISLASRIESRFFTMDVARQTGGDWRVVELGDGQVAALPPSADPGDFYAALLARLSRSG